MNGLDVMRLQTAAFVRQQPVVVELSREVTVDDGEGGRTVTRSLPRPGQVVTLCEPGSSGYGVPSHTAEGTRDDVDFLLVGAWDADVAAGDLFDLREVRYRVEKVLPANGWETRATVVMVGRVP